MFQLRLKMNTSIVHSKQYIMDSIYINLQQFLNWYVLYVAMQQTLNYLYIKMTDRNLSSATVNIWCVSSSYQTEYTRWLVYNNEMHFLNMFSK